MKVIPAIDLIDGKCVRLQKGDYSRMKEYNEDPLEQAKQFEQAGIKNLHLVDLDAAVNRPGNLKVLENIATQTSLTIDFGGGIRGDEQLESALNAGASKITAGSISYKEPELVKKWMQKYPGKIILGADVLGRNIAINGWQTVTEMSIDSMIQNFQQDDTLTVICTSIEKDGMMVGPDIDLYKELQDLYSINVIASGGVGCKEDLDQLEEIGVEGVIVGKAFYEGRIKLKELISYVD